MRPDEDWVSSTDEPLSLQLALTRYQRELGDPLERRKIQNRIAQRAYSTSPMLAQYSWIITAIDTIPQRITSYADA